MNEYAKDHNGLPPSTWEDLHGYLDFYRAELNFGAPVQSKMMLFGTAPLILADFGGEELVAMTSFSISEDRRDGVGRYVVYRQENGRFAARWESEAVIQKAVVASGLLIPRAATYQEKPLKPFSQEYSNPLLGEAVKSGVPIAEALRVINQHVEDVSNGRAKTVKSWAELAAVSTPKAPGRTTPLSPVRATPAPPPPASPALPPGNSPPGALDVSETAKDGVPMWVWLGGAVALVATLVFVFKRRGSRLN